MIGARGRIQREDEVVHLVARRLTDLSLELVSVGDRDIAFPEPHGRGDITAVRGSITAACPKDRSRATSKMLIVTSTRSR